MFFRKAKKIIVWKQNAVFTYGLKTIAITQEAAEQLRVAQRAMEEP